MSGTSGRFEKILANSYDYDEALKRQNLKQEEVDRLREKIKHSEYVPSFIVDKQVNHRVVAKLIMTDILNSS